jgi:hypothetical protein
MKVVGGSNRCGASEARDRAVGVVTDPGVPCFEGGRCEDRASGVACGAPPDRRVVTDDARLDAPPGMGSATAPSPGPQRTALSRSAMILASSTAVNSLSAKAVGHMAPSSRSAASLKPSVAYLVLNFCALWKKQTTLPFLA